MGINIKKKKYICARYIRISTDKEEQKTSIPHQISLLEEHANYLSQIDSDNAEWVTPEEFVYIDEDISAYHVSLFERPKMKELIRDAKERKFHVVLFKSISRLARDTQEALAIKSTFESLGIIVIAPEDPYDSRNENSNLIFTIKSAVAEQESVNTSVRVRLGNKQKAKSGKWTNSRPPIGYIVDKETKKLKLGDEQHIQTVRTIFDLYVNEGWGTFKIAEYLNNKNWLTSNENLWSRNTVRQVIVNRAYVGDIVYGKTRNKITRSIDEGKRLKTVKIPQKDWIICYNAHPPIIDRNIFEAAQHILQSRKIGVKKKRLVHPLTGILKCGVCGEGMICQKRSSEWGEYRYYICKTYHKYGRNACPQNNIRAEDIERFVYEWLQEDIRKHKNDLDVMSYVEFNQKTKDEIVKEIAEIDKQIEKLNKDTLDLFRMRDNFSEEQYKFANEQLKKDIEILSEKKNHFNEELAKVEGEDNKSIILNLMDLFLQEDFYKVDSNELRKYFHSLLKNVRLNDEEVDIEVTYQHFIS